MAKENSLVRILRHGAGIVHRKGFHHTGIQEVLERADVPKGSFYHYFKSKEDFGLHLIDFFAGSIMARMEDSLVNSDLPPLERLRKFFGDFLVSFEKNSFEGGCPVGNLSQELGDEGGAFREKLMGVYTVMRDSIGKCLEEARQRGDVSSMLDTEETADFILNSWEGAILRMKVTKDAGPLLIFDRMVFGTLLK